jgi:hypothetical protein
MSQRLTTPSGSGGRPSKGIDIDSVKPIEFEDEQEKAIYILTSYSSDVESRIKREFMGWKVFFITSKGDFNTRMQYCSPQAVFIPFLAGGPLKEFQISIINLMYNSIDERLILPNVYIEGAGDRIVTKDFGEESSIHNTIEFIRSSIPSSF